MKNFKFLSLTKMFKDYVVAEKSISLDNSFELPVLFKRLGWRLLEASFATGTVRLSLRVTQLTNFGLFLLRMRRHHGATYVVKYLKACQLALQKRISLDPISSLRDLESDLPLPRLRSGLPSVIPVFDRRSILRGSPNVIRWWLTLFSVYRIIKIPGKLKLSTITDPYSGSWEGLAKSQDELKIISTRFFLRFNQEPQLHSPELIFPETSSPSTKVSWAGLISDWIHLDKAGMVDPLKVILACCKPDKEYLYLVNAVEIAAQAVKECRMASPTVSPFKKEGSEKVGQLALKEEAAGKIRVFAMVDVWTQSILRPLHQFLFSFLKSLPNDGTHNQEASIQRCFEKSKIAGCSFGYDLSAATDRLPIALQMSVLEPIFGKEFVIAWHKVLVGRSYDLKDVGSLNYAVGQPMGALSSWAMLAVTHHFIVQSAASRAGYPRVWFKNYELLGDDINIFDAEVAKHYLDIMSEIGVPINASKSVVARNSSFEFAKVTGFCGHNVSAISFKMFLSQNTLMGRANILYSLLRKNLGIRSPIKYMRTLSQQGFRTQGDNRYSYLALLSMFINGGRYRLEDFFSLLTRGPDAKVMTYADLLSSVNPLTVENILCQLVKGLKPSVLKPFDSKGRIYPWMRVRGLMEREMESKVLEYLGDLQNFQIRLGFKIAKVLFETANVPWLVNYDHFLVPRHLETDFLVLSQIRVWRAIVPLIDRHTKRILVELGTGIPKENSLPGWLNRFVNADMRPYRDSVTLSDWFALVDLVDRLREIEDLVVRGLTKVTTEVNPSLVRKESPLKYVKIYVKTARKGRSIKRLRAYRNISIYPIFK